MVIHYCTPLSVGMMLKLGTGWWSPIRGSVFIEQLPRPYLVDFGRLFSKNACSIHCQRREKDCLSKVYLNPLKFFKGYDQTNMQQTRKRRGITFLELRGAPSFWKMTPPESHGLYWGLKHSENGQNFFHASHIQKLHFAKKNGQKRPTHPSAVVWRKHCREYGVTTTN